MSTKWDRGLRIGGKEGGREEEEEEEDTKGKEESGFLEFLSPEPTSWSEQGNQQSLGTRRTLALDSWDVPSWVMAQQALGLQGLGAPYCIRGLVTC